MPAVQLHLRSFATDYNSPRPSARTGTATSWIHAQLYLAHHCTRCTPPFGLHLRSNARSAMKSPLSQPLAFSAANPHPHPAAFRSACKRCTPPFGLHLRSTAFAQPLAFGAASCIWRLQRFDAPRSCSHPPLHAADAV